MAKSDKAGSRAKKQACSRCGTCCLRGGPALHGQDVALVRDGVLPLANLVTVRSGEPVFDQGQNRFVPLREEIVKIRGKKTWSCTYLAEDLRSCTIYAKRPAECRAMKCWDTREIEAMYEQGRLTRMDLMDGDAALVDFVMRHERRCSWVRMGRLVKMLRTEDREKAEHSILETLEFDGRAREALVAEHGRPEEEEWFHLGRPLAMLLGAFGLRLREEAGRRFLVPSAPDVE